MLLQGPYSSFPVPHSALKLQVVELLGQDQGSGTFENYKTILDQGLEELGLETEAARLFDIQLLRDGVVVELAGPVELSFGGLDSETGSRVFHVDEVEGITEQTAQESDDGQLVITTDHFSVFAVMGEGLPTITPFAAPLAPISTVDNRPLGITLNLFDYWSSTSSTTTYTKYLINKGKNLQFNLGEGSGYNNWTGSARSYPGILQRELLGGYPSINPNPPTGSGDSQSADYLFNPDLTHEGKESFKNVNGLFKEENGYLVFDSEKNYAYYDKDLGNDRNFIIYGGTYGHEDKSGSIGFFPFNAYDDNRTSTATTSGFNHFFGLTMESSFQMPPGGMIDGNPMIFEFRGDDDAWVFIDGVLVLDIGGIHDSMTGSINFVTGEVKIQNAPDADIVTSIADQFDLAPGRSWDGSDYSEHTINFYYLERGANKSNLMMRFNLPTYAKKDLKISKAVIDVNNTVDPNKEYDFQLFVNRGGNTAYDLYEGPATYDDSTPVIFDNDGIFKIRAGQTVTVPGIDEPKNYYLKEVNMTPGQFSAVTFNGQLLEPVQDGEGGCYVETPRMTVKDQFEVYLTNVMGDSLTNLRVEKRWEDDDANHGGHSVYFSLIDEQKHPITYYGYNRFTLNADNQWTMEFTGLPIQDYAVEEEPFEGYESACFGEVGWDGVPVLVIKNKPKIGSGSIEVVKEWYQPDGSTLSRVPFESVEVQLLSQTRESGPPVEYEVSFRVKDSRGSNSYTTFMTEKVPEGGWIDFATGMYTDIDPVNVTSVPMGVYKTNRYHKFVLGAYDFHNAAIYRLDNVMQNTVVTVDYSYSMQAETILVQSLWHSEISEPAGGSGDWSDPQAVDGVEPLTIKKSDGWRGVWDDLQSNSDIRYSVEETSVDGEPLTGNTTIAVDYENNQGIEFGTITVKNKVPVLIVEKKWYRPNGEEYEEESVQKVVLDLYCQQEEITIDQHEITFILPDRTSRKVTVDHGSTLEFASIYRDRKWQLHPPFLTYHYYHPESALPALLTSSLHTFDSKWGDEGQGKIYELPNIASNLTVDVNYSSPSGTLSFWSQETKPSGSSINEVKIDTITLDESGSWALTRPLSGDGCKYLVKEIEIDGEIPEHTNFQVTYVNNEGIPFGIITVENQQILAFSDFELPETGGLGAHKYWISGLLLVTAAFTYGFKRNRRERRTNI